MAQIPAESTHRLSRRNFLKTGVDAVTVGYKSTAEIDEAIENVNLALV